MAHTLEVRNVTKKYERFTLDGVSFDLPKGCIMGVVGENGAGKSTLFKAILNLLHRNAGEILFWGQQMTDKDTELREQIGVAFDTICFAEILTAKQVGKISSLTYKNWDAAEFSKLLERFGLPEKAEIKTYSKGMKMKLNLAVAMSHHAKLLILDFYRSRHELYHFHIWILNTTFISPVNFWLSCLCLALGPFCLFGGFRIWRKIRQLEKEKQIYE